MKITEQMKLFLEPKSVALIGISRAAEEASFGLMGTMLDFGFSGRIYPIHPKMDELLGVKVYPSVKDVPGDIDMVVIAIAREAIPGVVRECVEKGIKAILITTQGFADADAEGKRLQTEIVKFAREAGARIIGPNTVGITNRFIKFTTSIAALEKVANNSLAFVSQSGVFSQGISPSTIIGKVIDLGNRCDVDFADVLEYLEDDPETKLIALHIESVRDGKRFLEVAARVSKKKPILALKTGKSAKGIKATLSHTGSLAGRDEVYDAAFKQCGIIRVNDTDELENLVKTFLYLPAMKGRRVAICLQSGAAGVMASDACETYNLKLAELSKGTREKIQSMSPPWQTIDNPLDTLPACLRHGYQDTYGTILRTLLDDDNIDAVLCFSHGVEPSKDHVLDITDILIELSSTYDKPLIPWIYWAPHVQEQIARLESTKRIVVYPSIERAVKALAAQRDYIEWRSPPSR